MAERFLKVSLKNMTAAEASEEEARSILTTHFAQPESPALLFSDGTSLRITKDREGNLMLRVNEPSADK